MAGRSRIRSPGPTLTLGFYPPAGIDLMWEQPSLVRFFDRLSSFTRHAWYDPRGNSTSSSPLPGGQPRIVETNVDDMVTVLDALGEERGVILGLAAGPSLLFAATHPARTARSCCST
jgi:hypothetical protein